MREDISGETNAVHLSALGVPVVLHASGARSSELAQAFESAWEWCLTDSPAEHSVADQIVIEAFLDKDDETVCKAQGAGLVASTSLSELMHWLTPLVTTRAITARASSLLMMHACVLADPSTGAAVVLAGPSGAGKTTLARTLGESFGYVTDECAAIRDDHTVVPFPKPLSLVTGSPSGVKDQASPSSLGLVEPPASPRVMAVLYLDRRPDAPAEACLSEVPNVHALGLLCPQVSFVGSRPAPLQRIVSLLDAAGGLRRVSYREAADLRAVVGRLLDSGAGRVSPPPAARPSLDGVPVPPRHLPHSSAPQGEGMKVTRTPYLDEYVEDGQSAVLVDDQVFVLSELATTILGSVRDAPLDVRTLAAVLGEAFGAPPDGTDLTEATTAAVEALSRLGLLQLS